MVGNEKKENDVQTSALKAEAPVTLQDLEAVFQRHNRLVFRSAYRVTGNPSDAEDVMQTVFLRLLRREGSLELGSNPEGYLHRAAVNAALDLLRSRKSARSISLEDTSAQATQDFSPGPEARHAATEIREWLRDAVGRLNNTAAEMFVLRYFEGYGNREIADLMGTSQGTVAVTLHRTRSRLQEEIGSLFKRN